MAIGDKNIPAKPTPGTRKRINYSLRSEAANEKTTPKQREDLFLTPNKSLATAATLSNLNFICDICKGNETIRNANLHETMKSFSDQIKQLSSVTKTLKDSNSDINHMSDALKHFIMTFDHKTINNDFSKVFTSTNDLSNNFIDLSNYMSNFSEIEPMLSKYTESQSFYNAEARKAHIDAVALNDKKLSEISIEIESLKNHTKELRSNSTPVDTEINDQEGNPFSINKAGNRVINKSSDLHENPTSYIKAHQESCISEDLKTSLMSYLSENFEKDTEEGKQIVIYG